MEDRKILTPAAKEVHLRIRSAPWDDILTDDELHTLSDLIEETGSSDVPSEVETSDYEVYSSPQINILVKPLPPTWYKSVVVTSQQQTPDPSVQQVIQHGASLPLPRHAPRAFITTPTSPLMDTVIADLFRHGIIRSFFTSQ